MKGMIGAHSSSASPQHGLTDRLARWAKGLSGRTDEPEEVEITARARPGAASSREINRRRQLYADIGDFLFAHDLDLTPTNFSVALDYLTGANIGVEKAIRAAGLGLNPVVDGQTLRIPIPPLTEERRKDLVKLAGKYAEQQKIAVRNVRRDANDDLKKAERASDISQDEQKKMEAEVQKDTDAAVKRIDEMMKVKEAEIMQV